MKNSNQLWEALIRKHDEHCGKQFIITQFSYAIQQLLRIYVIVTKKQ